MVEYSDLIEIAIKKQIELTNQDVALRQARTVPDLTVDDDGHVIAIDGPGKRVLEEVVESYSEIMGEVAESLIAYALRDAHDITDIDLPDAIRSHL